MSTNVSIPSLGDSISKVTLLKWLKNDGDYVKVDEPLIEVETDKANTEIPAPIAGVLKQSRKAGDSLNVGDAFASIDEAGKPAAATPKIEAPKAEAVAARIAVEAPKAAAQAPTPVVPPKPPAAAAVSPADLEDLNPSVRPLIAEYKLDPKKIPGTGPHGRLLKEDVLKYLEAGNNGRAETTPTPAPPVTPAPIAPAPPIPEARPATVAKPSSAAPAPADYNAAGVARVAMSKFQKKTAENLKVAQNTAAILTTFNEVDMSAIMDMRARLKERFEKAHGVGLGFMSFFARAVILGLREFPRINAFIDGDDIVYHSHVNLGIAVSSEKGLTVPVLKNAELMSFAKIESEIKRLATAVREGKLGLQELFGGTFTITNGGVFGSLLSTPIINPPQSGILGMHAINKRPVAINDKVEIRPMMYIALSYDHRMVNGKDSVSFLVRLKEYLEDPARLMLEV